MQISCECKKFRAELKTFPKNTPGRLKCYCDDCQTFLHHLGRGDLLDENAGTEVVPIYPADFKILSGQENLKCTRLSAKGMYRFSTSCCNTPIANSRAGLPWLGVFRATFNVNELERALGPVRASIMGKFAKGTPPKGTPQTFNLKGFLMVFPYILKGKILKKGAPSPFFSAQFEPIVMPRILSEDENLAARKLAGV
jgi:hypothetical protein